MKVVTKVALVLLVVLAISRLSPPLGADPSQEPQKAVLQVPTGVEIMRPADVKTRVDMMLNLRPRLAGMRRDSAKKLSAAGLATTSIQTGIVIRGQRQQPGELKANHLLGQMLDVVMPNVKAQAADDLEPSGEIGYLIIDSWDDRDDRTWEGTFWGYVPDIDGQFCFSFQMDTSVSDADTPPSLMASYGGGFSSFGRGFREITDKDVAHLLGRLTRALLHVKPASDTPLVPTAMVERITASSTSVPPQTCGCELAGTGELGDCFLENVLGDSWKACAVAGASCGLAGPLWPECVGLACGGWIAVELIEELWSWAWTCMT
jgi:hypothetical protein